jgi:hypothetical protein
MGYVTYFSALFLAFLLYVLLYSIGLPAGVAFLVSLLAVAGFIAFMLKGGTKN